MQRFRRSSGELAPAVKPAISGSAAAAALALGLLLPAVSIAQTPGAPATTPAVAREATTRPTLRAHRVEAGLSIDGRLDEAFYTANAPSDQLVQAVPVEGGVPSQRTETWFGFDESNVYVSARIYDTAGEDGWIANEMRRDSQQLRANDSFGFYLDTYLDRRNAAGFFVNAIGGFADVQLTNEGSPNFDWNPVWDVQTGRFDGGWTMEAAIPFKSLRYRPGTEQTWGVQLRRSVLRDNEWSYLTPIPIQLAGSTGSNGIFRVSLYGDLVGIEAPPQGLNLEVKPYVTSRLNTDLVANPQIENDVLAEAGLDIKYALTPNLTLDLTANTDFAQVEVDEQQVNLTRFNIQFPEKRDFFLEGRGVYDFGTGRTGAAGPGGGGGPAPTLFYSRRIGIQGSTPVQVLGGGRLTGKVGAFDVGLLSIQTADDDAVNAVSTNFTVVRVKRDVFGGNSIGGLFGNRSASLAVPGESNQTWGVDGSFAMGTNASMIAYYARTHTPGQGGNDQSYRGRFNYDADLFGGSAEYLVVGDDFNPEVGFVRRRDFQYSSLGGRFSPRPSGIPWIRQMHFRADVGYFESDSAAYVESRDRGGQFSVDLENGDGFSVGFGNNYEFLPTNERISGALFPLGEYDYSDYSISYRFGPQRKFQGNLSAQMGDFYSGERRSIGLGGGRVEVSSRISIEPSLEFNWLDLPQQTESGQFDQHVARTRATYTMSPRAYVSGLVQYSTGSDTFSGNFRLRWEWAPGSELFVVYTEDRDTEVLGDRWSELATRGLVIKVTRLFRP